jgi:hypothetical protein
MNLARVLTGLCAAAAARRGSTEGARATTAETTTMDDGAVGHRCRPTVAADEHLRARRYTAAF